MTTIKIEKENLKEISKKAISKVGDYKDKVIDAEVCFSDISESLQGKGYEGLLTQISQKIEAQKKLVVECDILAEEIDSYCDTMADSESSATFPS